MDEYERVLDRFAHVNSSSSKQEANAIIGVYIEHGAKEAMLREVFGIGYTRYEKILNKKLDRPSGGRNNAAVSDVMLAQLARFAAHGVKTELRLVILADIVVNSDMLRILLLPLGKIFISCIF